MLDTQVLHVFLGGSGCQDETRKGFPMLCKIRKPSVQGVSVLGNGHSSSKLLEQGIFTGRSVVNFLEKQLFSTTADNGDGPKSGTAAGQDAQNDSYNKNSRRIDSSKNGESISTSQDGTTKGDKKSPGRGRKSQMSKSLQSAQERVAELLSPGKDTLMLHENQSYEILGKAEDAPKVVAGASARAQEISPSRIHPHRLFYPGAKYSPEELNPYKAKEVLMRSDLTVRRGNIPKDVVNDQADFRNTEFLTYFLKDSGKLVPRRRTKLPAKLHRELMREIKLSRSLGLMNFLSKDTVSKV